MITISNLSNKKAGNDFVFSDVHLDFIEKKVSMNKRNNNVVAGNDILIDTDSVAIRNSIINILFQKRYLVPLFDINIRKYLGMPVSDMTSKTIGNSIQKGLTLFEPRIKLQKILVQADIDHFQYRVGIFYSLVNFTQEMQSIIGTLDNVGNFVLTKE